MIDGACAHFQRIAWDWLQSGEMSRTNHLLSPLEELGGFNYGFVYLMRVSAQTFKIGYSLHPMRRLHELMPQYGDQLRLVTCFIGEPFQERVAHQRFRNLRLRNEVFYAHPLIEQYFAQARLEIKERLNQVHICAAACPQLNQRLDLRMLGAWLARA
ncbi:MAG: GIY-YIG nuclease family protein [Candidatus Eremiobacteraeota bacterium]|nr:GIY-YIG nuclease family protein [Candidatus Eremiobacteraeota bacterium]